MSEIQAKYWTTIACDSRKAGAPTMEDKILRTINTTIPPTTSKERTERPIKACWRFFFCHVKGCKPFSFYF